jgi:hypothetical protein
VFSFAAGKSIATFSIIDGRIITNTPKLDTQADSRFVTPAERTDGTQTSVSVDESLETDLLNDPLFVVDASDSLTSTTEKRRVTVAAAAAARTVPSGFEILEITDNTRDSTTPIEIDVPERVTTIGYEQSDEIEYVDTENP